MTTENHCLWSGISCDTKSRVTTLNLQGKELTGSLSSTLGDLDEIQYMDLSINTLSGAIPASVCELSNSNSLYLVADASNCPNDYNEIDGTFAAGCCSNVVILENFISTKYGSTDCSSSTGTDLNVCTYMKSRNNHDVYQNTNSPLPTYKWLEVSHWK